MVIFYSYVSLPEGIIPYPSPPFYQIPFFEIVRIYAYMWSARNDMCEQKPCVLNLDIALHSSESIPFTFFGIPATSGWECSIGP